MWSVGDPFNARTPRNTDLGAQRPVTLVMRSAPAQGALSMGADVRNW